jgi:hypothetical protein
MGGFQWRALFASKVSLYTTLLMLILAKTFGYVNLLRLYTPKLLNMHMGPLINVGFSNA